MALDLSLHTTPEVPLEAESICPDKITGLSESSISALNIQYGNQLACIGDFFNVKGTADGTIHVQGDCSRIKHLGAGMSDGKIIIHGNAGAHLGTGMSGGEILVEGNAADWVGPEMSGGKIIVLGDAGHMVGSVYRGGNIGMNGGMIIIHGNAKNEVGHAMRNGLIVIGGNCGDYAGVNMLAGTIVVLGQPGIRPGAGMQRGTIISMFQAEILPTFRYSCLYHPIFIRVLLQYVTKNGLTVDTQYYSGQYQRWCGDSVAQNKGEILIYQE